MTATINHQETEKAQQLMVLMSVAERLQVPYQYSWKSGLIDFSTATQTQTEALMCALSDYGELID